LKKEKVSMWQFEDNIATIKAGPVQLMLSLAEHDRKVLVQTETNLLLASLWDMPVIGGLPLVEAYVRGDDLVATFGPSDSFPFTTELYWTARTLESQPTPVVALSLLVSVRTDLLDTHPELNVVTSAPRKAMRTLPTGDGPLFVSPLREAVTLVDFAPEEDCTKQAEQESKSGATDIERTLFSHFLEKGVIRRARLLAVLAPEGITDDQAAGYCEEFLAAELPLTT